MLFDSAHISYLYLFSICTNFVIIKDVYAVVLVRMPLVNVRGKTLNFLVHHQDC